MDDFERGRLLVGRSRMEGSYSQAGSVAMTTAEAIGDSKGGYVRAVMSGNVVSGDDNAAVTLPTTVDCRKGDELIVTVTGGKPVVTGVVGEGDRTYGWIAANAASIGQLQVGKLDAEEAEITYAKIDELDAKYASVDELEAASAKIGKLEADSAAFEGSISAAEADIADLKAKDAEITGTLDAASASIENLEATKLDADVAEVTYATIDGLTATDAKITSLEGTYAKFEETTTTTLTAHDASIKNLEADKLDAGTAEITYAKIDDLSATNGRVTTLETYNTTVKDTLTATNAEITSLKAKDAEITDTLTALNADVENLDATKLDAESAKITYANIDFSNIGQAAIEKFFSESGMIDDLVVGDHTVTGTLVGVTIIGDNIEAGTVKADRLVVQGTDGLYYKLNLTGETVAAEQTEYNSLSGKVITAKSITAEKVSVDDLVAFGATIGGYTITSDALYSGAKSSATNTTRGVYMNDDGEFSIGDLDNYVRFYKDTDGSYKLAISIAGDAPAMSGDLGDYYTKAETTSAIEASAEAVSQSVSSKYATITTVEALQNIADNAIETWTGTEAPTEENSPASSWTPDDLKKQHSGDVYYDTETGYSYRWGSSDGSTYSWTQIKDSDITKAISNAADAQSAAESAGELAGKAVASTDTLYYATASSAGAPSPPTSADEVSAESAYDSWCDVIPTYDSEHVYLYTCTKFTDGGGNSWFSFAEPSSYADYLDTIYKTTVSNTERIEANSTEISLRLTKQQAIDVLVGGAGNIALSTADEREIEAGGFSAWLVHGSLEVGADYSIGVDMLGDGESSVTVGFGTVADDRSTCEILQAVSEGDVPAADDWERLTWGFSFSEETVVTWVIVRNDGDGAVKARHLKVEQGSTPTEWASSIYDHDSVVSDLQVALDNIEQEIRSLVTDSDGTSLMTQTSTGWTFDVSTIQDEIDKVNGAVSEYFRFDDAGLTISREGSDFAVNIANDQMSFLDGSTVVAYVSNQKLYISKAVVRQAFRIGDSSGYGFVWAMRANNHLGLRYILDS